MRDFSDRRPVSPTNGAAGAKKRLGGYLVEAGLLTPAQVDVALNDQKLTGMRFGEILAARGWVKQQTIEYLMTKVVLPEQQASSRQGQVHRVSTIPTATSQLESPPGAASAASARTSTVTPHASPESSKQPVRRDAPIAKPLPSNGQADGDISWVG